VIGCLSLAALFLNPLTNSPSPMGLTLHAMLCIKQHRLLPKHPTPMQLPLLTIPIKLALLKIRLSACHLALHPPVNQHHASCFHVYSTFCGSQRHSVNSTQGQHWKAAGTLTNSCGLQCLTPLLETSSHTVLTIQRNTYMLCPACFEVLIFHCIAGLLCGF